jgi:hypothetical protein
MDIHESIQIYLNSSNCDKILTSGYTTDILFNIPTIDVADGMQFYISVQNALIPYSFYNVNSSNNILNYYLNFTDYSVIIPIGNYNINQLISELMSSMQDMTIKYNNIQNTLTFTHATDEFLIFSTSTCLGLIGLTTTARSTSKSLTSTICINVNPIKCINIVSNLTTYSINKAFPNNASILCCVPVKTSPYSLIEYVNQNNFKTNLYMNQLSELRIKLTDDYGNLINLNGCHFSLTVQLDVVPFTN